MEIITKINILYENLNKSLKTIFPMHGYALLSTHYTIATYYMSCVHVATMTKNLHNKHDTRFCLNQKHYCNYAALQGNIKFLIK